MSKPVDPSQIEKIVGSKRDPYLHIGRAVAGLREVYILHSKMCLEYHDDLRNCLYSQWLDVGIDTTLWEPWQDRPVVLDITSAGLVPLRKLPMRLG